MELVVEALYLVVVAAIDGRLEIGLDRLERNEVGLLDPIGRAGR